MDTARKIFVNLPVKDLDKSKQFFGKLGSSFNEQFTDANGRVHGVSEDVYAKAVQQAERRPLVARFCPSVVV